MLSKGDSRLAQWLERASKSRECMEDAKRLPVAGHEQSLEDRPDVCSSESAAEYSDHGEMWLDEAM
jgi:hypothetical protein